VVPPDANHGEPHETNARRGLVARVYAKDGSPLFQGNGDAAARFLFPPGRRRQCHRRGHRCVFSGRPASGSPRLPEGSSTAFAWPLSCADRAQRDHLGRVRPARRLRSSSAPNAPSALIGGADCAQRATATPCAQRARHRRPRRPLGPAPSATIGAHCAQRAHRAYLPRPPCSFHARRTYSARAEMGSIPARSDIF
jgi:hypothetical protein